MCNNARSLGTVTDEMLSFKTHCGIFVCKGILKLSFLFGISLDSPFRQGNTILLLFDQSDLFFHHQFHFSHLFLGVLLSGHYLILQKFCFRHQISSDPFDTWSQQICKPLPHHLWPTSPTRDVGLMSKAICSSSSPVSILQMDTGEIFKILSLWLHLVSIQRS